MHAIFRLPTALGALAVLAACAPKGTGGAPSAGQSPAAAVIRPEALMAHVAVLAADSLEGRQIGTPGSAKARAYLTRAFAAAGMQPLGTSFELAAEIRSPRDSSIRRGTNVVGHIRGRTNPERYIVVSAHYDHLGVRQGQVFNGADDDASGTAALIELARWFHANPPANSIIFAAFDGEEGGMVGSNAFVRQPPVAVERIVMDVNLDMIGRNAQNEIYAAGTGHYPFLKPYLDSAIARSRITVKYGHDSNAGKPGDDWTNSSDHAPFHRARIPFVYFGVEDHPDYHKATDEVQGIMPDFYTGAVLTVLDAVRLFDRHLTAIEAARAGRARP